MREGRFMSAYDMAKFTKGASKEGLSLHSQTIQAVSEEYVARRNKVLSESKSQSKKNFKSEKDQAKYKAWLKRAKIGKLRWRVSHGSERSLGWIPVKACALSYRNGQVHYQGTPLSLWDSYGLKDYEIRWPFVVLCGSCKVGADGVRRLAAMI